MPSQGVEKLFKLLLFVSSLFPGDTFELSSSPFGVTPFFPQDGHSQPVNSHKPFIPIKMEGNQANQYLIIINR